MNIIFISPNYPEDRWRYIHALRGLGVNVLGIGDADEEFFPHGLKGCLTDYYKVDDLHNYDDAQQFSSPAQNSRTRQWRASNQVVR